MNHVWVSVSHRGYRARFSPTFVSANPSLSGAVSGGERRAVADVLDPAKRGEAGDQRGDEEQRALRPRLRAAEDHRNEHERRKRRKVRPDHDGDRRKRARPGGARRGDPLAAASSAPSQQAAAGTSLIGWTT